MHNLKIRNEYFNTHTNDSNHTNTNSESSISIEYEGRNFQHVSEINSKPSSKKIGRILLGGLVVAGSLGTALCSKRIRRLFKNPTLVDLTKQLPKEILLEIFILLSISDVKQCLRVNKRWRQIARSQHLWHQLIQQEKIFGPKQWEHYFSIKIDSVPPLPTNFYNLLQKPCDVFPEEKVFETSTVVLIPSNLETSSLENFEELIQNSEEGDKNKYKFDTQYLKHTCPIKLPQSSYWVIMLKRPLPTRDKSYKHQFKLIEILNKNNLNTYTVPAVLETAICTYTHHIRQKEWLFNEIEKDQLLCEENNSNHHLTASNFNDQGIRISNLYKHGIMENSHEYRTTVLRKL